MSDLRAGLLRPLHAHQHLDFGYSCEVFGRCWASGDGSGNVLVGEAATGREGARLRAGPNAVRGLGLSLEPGGSAALACAGDDGDVAVYRG